MHSTCITIKDLGRSVCQSRDRGSLHGIVRCLPSSRRRILASRLLELRTLIVMVMVMVMVAFWESKVVCLLEKLFVLVELASGVGVELVSWISVLCFV